MRPDQPDLLTGSAIVLERPDRPVVSVVVLAWQQAALLEQGLRSLAGHRSATPFETVVVLNGAADDVRALVAERVSGAVVVDSPVNVGFSGGNLHGASVARGEHLVLLNDDAAVLDGWLDHLVAAAADPDVGAVTSCVLFPDGTVQDAGGVIWSDGTTAVLGRHRPPEDLLRAGRRVVDYGSGCSLLVRRSAWDAVGGFDEGYAPAYYEDADLCLGLRRAGYRVLVEPRSMVVHHESASSTTRYKRFLFERNHRRLVERWRPVLAAQPDPAALGPDPIGRAARLLDRRTAGRSVLVIDDRAPRPSAGAGYSRMLETLSEVGQLPDTRVVLGPGHVRDHADEVAVARQGIPVVVEDLDEHLADLDVRYDLVVISRPPNVQRYLPVVRAHQPQATVVYDTEALYHRRLVLQAGFAADPDTRLSLTNYARRMEAIERRVRLDCDHVISLSTDEADWLRSLRGDAGVSYVPPVAARWDLGGAGFHERRGAVFAAGWLGGADSPNGDGLRWLAGEVLPVARGIDPDLEVGVTGGELPPQLTHLVGPGLRSLGIVEDLADLYAGARVSVAPVRYGAGVKIKVLEALQHGVPVVTTTIGAEGFPPDLADLLVVTDDPGEFARRTAELTTDHRAWARQRSRIEAAADRWRRSPRRSVATVVGELLDQRAAAGPGHEATAAGAGASR